METLRLKETVYTIQPINPNNQRSRRTDDRIGDRASTPIQEGTNDIQYMEGQNSELICQIGMRKSYLLRHGTRYERIHTDNQGYQTQGYVTMEALLGWLNKDIKNSLYSDDIIWIVDTSDKASFSIDKIKGIKSNNGHSIELPDMKMKEYIENAIGNKRYIVHETCSKNLPTILQGLSRMERNQIHL